MFQVNQRVQITAPNVLRMIEQRKASPTGTIVAIVPDSRWPIKVLLDDGQSFAIPFSFNGEVCNFNFSFMDDGRHNHGDLQPGLVVVNV